MPLWMKHVADDAVGGSVPDDLGTLDAFNHGYQSPREHFLGLTESKSGRFTLKKCRYWLQRFCLLTKP